ncbi:MAG: hypothetical protein DRO89_02770 [Candidatus Altiarchaeales archaeon]|nr:MAG: hypothetical protein DRO89_02770 [Candidatus Altiarchaeales archaeon]
MTGDIRKTLERIISSEEKAASEWMKRTKENMELKEWLKKAEHYEKSNNFRLALDAYLNFMELKLRIIKSRPEYTVRDYLNLVPYYIKIGDCYKKIKHYKKEDRLRDFERAAEYYKKAASMYMELEDYTSANVYLEFASKTYDEIGLYGKSAECFKEIAEIYLKLKNNLVAGRFHSKAGDLYEKAKDYESAFESYLKSAELNSGMGNMSAASRDYKKVAEVLRKQGKHDEAIKYYIISAELDTKLEHYLDVAKTYTGIAQDYEETNNLEDATYYYIKAAEISLDNDDAFASTSFKNAARCYRKMKRYEDAIKYYIKSTNISLRLGNQIDAAHSCWDVAECYKLLGKYDCAADFYLKYAEYGALEEKGTEYLEGYKKSAEIYSEIGDARVKENNFAEAIKCYKKAAMCYDSLENYPKAGELYLKAGLIEKREDIGDFFETCTIAAERYKKAGELYHAAECYLEINEYLQAARSFTEYADKQLDKNLFYAGEGYRRAGICYGELNQKDPMINRYNKAIQEYLKYIDKLNKMGVTKDETSNIGEAYLGVAESNRMLDNLLNAKKYFKKALDYFEKNGMKDRAILANAFLSKVSAKLAIQHGDYPLATDLLSTSIENFEKAIARGGWNERYLKFLEDNMEEARKMLTEIGEKPEITLLMDRYSYSFVGTPLIINMNISNQGNQPINKITFLSQLPEDLELIKPPSPIEKLAAKESSRDFIKLITKKRGKYRIKPLEVLYEDKRGNKYVKASNLVSIEIVEKPVMEYKNYRDVIEKYQKYADTQLKNKNYFYAGEGYKGLAECYRIFTPKRSSDSVKMVEYYKKAIDSYQQHINELKKIEKLSSEQLSQLSDTHFKIGDCYEAMGDLSSSEKYLGESIEYYRMAIERTHREKEKRWMELQVNVVRAFSFRVKARMAIQNEDYETAEELLEKSINTFEDLLGSGGDKEYEDFLKKNQKDSRDLLVSVKSRRAK